MIEKIREKSQAKRRARNKAKADAAFDKAYDDSKSSASSASSAPGQAPRAALYEGKMGSSHKKASKLQRASKGSMGSKSAARSNGSSKLASADGVSEKLQGAFGSLGSLAGVAKAPASKIASIKGSPSLLRIVVGAACFFFVLLMLYGPAQQYYCQMRETDRIQAEYAAVAARNDTLSDAIHLLSTDEGIADKAHADLGYVKAGEQTGVVSGIEIEDEKGFQGNVAPGSIPPPDTWYSPMLDVLFGYDYR